MHKFGAALSVFTQAREETKSTFTPEEELAWATISDLSLSDTKRLEALNLLVSPSSTTWCAYTRPQALVFEEAQQRLQRILIRIEELIV